MLIDIKGIFSTVICYMTNWLGQLHSDQLLVNLCEIKLIDSSFYKLTKIGNNGNKGLTE